MTKDDAEQRKVVVRKSFGRAILQCLPHLASIITSTAIIFVNLKGIYIGVDFRDIMRSDTLTLMGFQLIAKGNEILVVASLSLIVLHVLRNELLFGAGVPLGFIGSGMSFSDLMFFFSKEFIGGLLSLRRGGFLIRRLAVVILLLVSGCIAMLTGPVSATLLVPKSQDFAASKHDFVLNGTMSQFWPSDLSSEVDEIRQICNTTTTFQQDVCPAAGFKSLRQHWSGMNYTNFISHTVPPYAKELASSLFYWPVDSPKSYVPPLYIMGGPRNDAGRFNPSTWLVQAHAATATILQQVAANWWTRLRSQLTISSSRIDDRNVKALVHSAIADVRCASPQNLSISEHMVQFSTIQYWTFWNGSAFTTNVENLTAYPSSQLRLQWFHLPQSFGPSSIGAIFQSPWDATNSSRVVVGCSAQLGWVPAYTITDSYTFWTGWYPWGVSFGARIPTYDAAADAQSTPSNGRVAVPDEWLSLLTPEVHDLDSGPEAPLTTTLELILESAGFGITGQPWNGTTLTEDWTNSDGLPMGGKTRLLEAIIGSVLVDGLSRAGSNRVVKGLDVTAKWLPEDYYTTESSLQTGTLDSIGITELQANMHITGYAYKASLTSYLSMAVLLTHILMATVHTFWVGIYQQYLHSWKSTAELVTLAQNSEPNASVLANTGAGIEKLKTFAQIGKVRVRPARKTGERHVELVFSDELPGDDHERAIASHKQAKSRTSCEEHSPGRTQAAQKSWTFPVTEELRQRLGMARRRTFEPELVPLRDSGHDPERPNDIVVIGQAYG